MGIFDRLRSAGQTVANSDRVNAETSEQDATRLIEQGHALEAEGKLDEAMQRYLEAIRLAPNPARAHLNLGNVLLLKGDLPGALDAFRTAIKFKPDYAGAYYNIGNALVGNDQLDEAVASYRQALEIQPDYAEVHCALGVALKELGQLDGAVESFQKALEIDPDMVEAHSNLGYTLHELCNKGITLLNNGKLDDAVAIFQSALRANPDFAEAHSNLGIALQQLGKLDDAMASYRRALEIKPDLAEAHINLGNMLQNIGQLDDAVVSYLRALEIKPDFAEAYINLGTALQSQERFAEAEANYRHALEIQPDSAEAHVNLGSVLGNTGQLNDALANYRRAAELQPHVFRHAILAQLLLPIIPESIGHIAEWRERYQNGIASLMKLPGTLDEPGDQLGSPSFYLAYHNKNDRPLMEALCRLFRARVPDLTATAPHVPDWESPVPSGRRIRVGFLSQFLVGHTIGHLNQGFIHRLNRNRFEVVLIHGHKAERDSFRQGLDKLADKVITLPAKLKDQQQVIAAEQLDVLFYPDIGMSQFTYFLAYARLAPVQATTWGHPDTTGLDTMDYFVSVTSFEPEGAETNYSERLIRMNRLNCYYQPPKISERLPSRIELGLPETGTLYGCPQTLYKFHPDFDAVLAAVADGDPSGHIVLLEGKYSIWTDLLKARWGKNYPILLDRVLFLPPMPRDRFMALQARMDVLLDPIHFGGGNTFYEAMIYGTPMVTWPGSLMRSRIAAGGYWQMGVADAPIAQRLEDYAPLALALGRDTARRQALCAASKDTAERELFEDMQAVREFEAFLENAVEAAAKGQKISEGWRPDGNI